MKQRAQLVWGAWGAVRLAMARSASSTMAAAPSYRRLLEQLRPGFLLGLPATPERQDGHDVLALCDFNIAYEVRLIEAINRSWLVPFHYFGIADTTVEYSESFWRSSRLDVEKVENALMRGGRSDAGLRILAVAVQACAPAGKARWGRGA